MSCGKRNWELLLDCARRLTTDGRSVFTRQELIACVQTTHPGTQRSTLDPTIQGMTVNAPGGPPSAAGTPFEKVGRGQFRLRAAGATSSPGSVAPSMNPPSGRSRGATSRDALVRRRVAELIEDFPRYVETYDRTVPFQRAGQYHMHRATIDRLRELGSVNEALSDARYLRLLHDTLQKWGIGRRASRLVDRNAFADILRSKSDELVSLERMAIDDDASNPDDVANEVWLLIEDMPVVDNRAKIVAGTKTLHHLLPDLVVPMDRAWTGAFFAWGQAAPQYQQQQTFVRTFTSFADVARKVDPALYVGDGWKTSRTKVLDNAVIGYCKDIGLGMS